MPRGFLSSFLIVILVIIVFFTRGDIFKTLNNLRNFRELEFQKLKVENEGLRLALRTLEEKYNAKDSATLTAKVYSNYPFNDRRLLVIDAGTKEGLRPGMPVLASPGILLGRVSEVRQNQSIVETLFDPKWRSSVNVETKGGNVKALLEGGARPLLTLIPKDADVLLGGKVFNISPDFPLGLLLGEVEKLKPSAAEVWLTAELKVFSLPEKVNEVLVLLDFP